MGLKLQAKFTLSHLLVTLISVVILASLIIGGYYFYLQSNLPASWAAEESAFIAEELNYYLDGESLNSELAREFIFMARLDQCDFRSLIS